MEEDNENGDEGYGLQVPLAFASELYRGAEDSTESTDETGSQEEHAKNDASSHERPAKVRKGRSIFFARARRARSFSSATTCTKGTSIL